MNKLFTKIAGLSLGLAMAIGVGVAVGSKEAKVANAAVPSNWVQCADVSDFAAGDSIIIATNDSSKYFNGATKSGPHWNASALSASAPASATADGVITLMSTGTANKYYLKLAGGTNSGKYVTATKAASKGSAISASDSSGWTFSKSSTNYFELNYAGNNAKFCSYSNSDFRSYASYNSGQQVTIYKYSARSLSSISVSTAPTKTTYLVGETFDPTGLVISRTWSSGNPDTYAYAGHTTEFTFSPTTSTALTTSNTSVTITYGGKSTTQAITVNAPKTPASVSSSGQTTTFEAGDTFAYGGTLTATYTDSTSGGVTPTSFKIGNADIDPTSAGTAIVPGTTALSSDDHNGKTVYVLYTENNTTVYTSYVITVNKISKITLDPTVTSSFPYQGITLTVTDGTLTNGTDYRVYKNQTMTITSTVGDMAKIEFTYSSASYDGGGWSSAYTPNDDTWTSPTTDGEQARITKIIVTLASTDPLVELDVSSATSVSMLKGDSNTSVKVHVANITTKTWTYTFDEDEEEGIATSSYINVSAGAAVSDVHTLTITTKAVGSTVLHISVSGTACATTIPVSVAAKPASMMVTESDHETQITTLELQSNGSTKQVYWIGEDTDGNAYSIAAAQVNGEIISGSSVTISSGAGTVITPHSSGTSVIRYSLNVLSSVYADITVNVVDDYKTTVNSITFNSNLSDKQGEPVDATAVFATKVANTHFGSTDTILDSEFLFSYENDRSNAEAIGIFSYDFTHGTTVDSTHKSQTVYVFVTFDSSYNDSFTITIEQKNDPLTAITFTNVTNNEVDVTRGSTFQLEWAYTPTNPTDGKEVEFVIDDNSEGIGITVSELGLISISASSGLGTALVLIQSAHDDTIQDYVYVTATLESMKYTVREAESLTPVSTVSAGDRVYMVVDNGTKTYEFSGLSSTSTVYGEGAEYSTDIAKLQLLIVEVGASSGTVSFKMSDGNYLNWSSSNSLTSNSTKSDNTSWTVDGSTITNAADTNRQLWWNNTNPRFACYTDKEGTTGYYCPTFIKVTGGDTEYDVTETLFNGVHNNFGAGKTYQWDATCSSFNSSNWLSACNALKSITGYSTYKLNLAVADLSGNEVEVFLAKYDAVIRKFGDNYDHLQRFTNGGINANSAININPLQTSVKNAGTSIAIIAISAVSLAAIGGYFLFRKKKEN